MERHLNFALVHIALWYVVSAQEGYRSVLAEQLDQYCELREGNSAPQIQRGGKAGPRGLPGPAGPPGNVNFTAVEKLLGVKFSEIQVEERLQQLEGRTTVLESARREKVNTDCGHVDRESAKTLTENGGVFDIYPGTSGRKIEVYCDLTTDGGGWTVFQKRFNGSENFERNWNDYVTGFGRRDGEFWMGLENIYRMVLRGQHELRVDLEDWDGNTAYAVYSSFSFDDAAANYRLRVNGYHGTAGDSLSYHHLQMFYTVDKDNNRNCARDHKGGWWYLGCHKSNLNGAYVKGGRYPSGSAAYGMDWYHWKNTFFYSMKSTEMKFRQKL